MKQVIAAVFLVALISLAPDGGLTLLPDGRVAAAGLDGFGLQQLYPNATGGLAWDSQHWNNGNPRSFTYQDWDPDDPTGWSRHSGSQCITIDGNEVMSFNKDCGGSIHPRLYLDPVTKDGKKFKNVEITGYHMRVADADLSYGGFTFGARGGPYGHNPSGDHCLATTYCGRIGNDGKTVVYKELVHATGTTKSVKTIFSEGFPYNQWVGMKFIVYNLDDGGVKLELYLDQTEGENGGTWELINEFVDDGTWSGGQDEELSECMAGGLFPDGEFHVISEGNGVVFTRDTDVDEGRYKWFTVREIAATFENQLPAADAGPDQTSIDADGDGVETVTLTGSGFDPDGSIVSYQWQEGSTVLGETPSITNNFTVGTHTVTLMVTDNGGATASDTVVITVVPPAVPDGWSSGDLESRTWSVSGNRKGRIARKDYSYQPPSSLNSIQQVSFTIKIAALDNSGSLNSDGVSPYVEVWILGKKKLLHQIGPALIPSGPGSITFTSTSAGVVESISLGKANQIRVRVGSLNQDKASGTNDRMDIDLAVVQITP